MERDRPSEETVDPEESFKGIGDAVEDASAEVA